MKKNRVLIIGGIASSLISLLHLVIIIGGPAYYRFFGAGEGMAQLAEKGSIYPSAVTLMIALLFAIAALYAFSGAGIIRRLPLLKPVLVIIGLAYTTRGVLGVPLVIYIDHPYLNKLQGMMTFMVLSSIVSLSFGLCYLIGLNQLRKQDLD